jgi:predicted ATPase
LFSNFGGHFRRYARALYAAEIAKDASVLCLDEFQVTDVADAMIIRRLLDQLWQRGVTLVGMGGGA